METPDITFAIAHSLSNNSFKRMGVELYEELAAKYPFPEDPLNGGWPPVRHLDGTVVRP